MPRLVQVAPDGSQEILQSTAHAVKSSRRLEEVRHRQQTIEQMISNLEPRIAGWEKQLEEALR
jgi:hypothetical protein